MNKLLETKVGAVVSRDYRTARVFSAHNIDFCCKGGISVAEACARNAADPAQVQAEIEALLVQQHLPDAEIAGYSMTQLIGHILEKHHAYVVHTGPILEQYLLKIANVHGQRHAELWDLHSHFKTCFSHLQQHMRKEEEMLFPLIEQLEKVTHTSPSLQQAQLNGPIGMMEHEHEEEGNRFRLMRKITHDFTPPADGCQTYNVAFRMLQEFEEDLHRHIHLENNVLFVRAQAFFN